MFTFYHMRYIMYVIRKFDGCGDKDYIFDLHDFVGARDFYDKADKRGECPIMGIVQDGVRVALIDDPTSFADCILGRVASGRAAG